MSHPMRFCIVLSVLCLGMSAARAVEIEAGPIWNDMDAQSKCPRVCGANGGQWKGQWRTTEPGRMSLCDCSGARPAPPPSYAGPVIRYDNTAFMSNDLGIGTPASSFDNCAAQCLADSRCVAFTYSRPGTCAIKSGVGMISQSMFATSGFVSSRGSAPPMPSSAAPPQNPPAVVAPNSCSVGGTAKCPGCSISCNPGERPDCTPPFDGVTMFCQRDASCRCISP